jgi:hexokinase
MARLITRHRVLPRTKFDQGIDETSARPDQQTYEKMVAAMYLGELLQLILLHFHESIGLFGDANMARLRNSGTMDAVSLSNMVKGTVSMQRPQQ